MPIMEQPIPLNDSDPENELNPTEAQATKTVKGPTIPPDALDVSEQTPLIVRNIDFYFEDAIIQVDNTSFAVENN